MGVTCQILINKPAGGHRPGQTVSGVVKYAIDEPLEVKSVVLSLSGRGRCSWSETDSNSEKSDSRSYSGDEEYFTAALDIIEKHNGITIPVGSYEYPFNFSLPVNLPPTFKNNSANISYVLLLKFKRPGAFHFSKKFTAEIPVHCCITEAEEPIVFGLDKVLTKPFSSRKHSVNLKAEIAKNILSPGDKANLNLVIKNDTGVNITAVKSELVRHKTYTAHCGQKKEEKFVVRGCTVESPSIPKNSSVNLTHEVPTLADMYSVLNSKIIKVEFKVRVTVRLPMPHVNAVVEAPVIIGDKFEEDSTDEPPSYWEVMRVEKNEKLLRTN